MIDDYKLLEISEDASIEVIKAAYRALAKKYHPDTYIGTECEQDNAYVDGCLMDVPTLIKHFRQAKGFKRSGYAKALEEKGLLIRDSEGNLKPSDELRYYL